MHRYFVKDKNKTYVEYDIGTLSNHNDNIWVDADNILNRETEYSSVTYNSTQRSIYLTGLSVGCAIDFIVKYEGISSGGGIGNIYHIESGSKSSLNWWSLNQMGILNYDGSWLSLRIEIGASSSKITLLSDASKTVTRNYDSQLSPNGLRFSVSTSTPSIKFKNLIVYEIQ